MTIVHKYKFHGGSDGGISAVIGLDDMATLLTSTVQLGGSSNSALKNLGVPAGLVLDSHHYADTSSTIANVLPMPLPEDMFDRMLSLVSPGEKMVVGLNRNKTKRDRAPSSKKTRRH